MTPKKMREFARAMGTAHGKVIQAECDKLGIPKDSPMRKCAKITITFCKPPRGMNEK